MSRIGKLAITIPSGTEVGVQSGEIVVKGKGGTLKRILHPAVSVTVEGGKVSVVPAQTTRLARALWGTYAAHVRNMIAGVNQPFTKRLQVEGIGFRAELAPPAAGRAGQQLKLQVGFSHPVMIDIPAGITATVEKNIISISGPDKEVVGDLPRAFAPSRSRSRTRARASGMKAKSCGKSRVRKPRRLPRRSVDSEQATVNRQQ